MAKLFNLARMSTATTGTGTITLGSAVSGFLTFALAGVADADVVSYGIRDGASSEVGTGTYTASGTTLTRTVTKSTNSDTAISLSGTAEVYVTFINGTKLEVEAASAATNTVSPILKLTSESTGTPAVGIGTGLEFEVETTAGNNEVLATIEAVAADVTAASEDGDLVFTTMVGGLTALEKMRIGGANGAIRIGGYPLDIPIIGFPNRVQIVADPNVEWALSLFAYSGSILGPFYTFAKSRSDIDGTHSIVAADDELGTISFTGSDGTNFVAGAYITSHVNGTPGTDNMPGRLAFWTNTGTAAPTEHLRISSLGVNPLIRILENEVNLADSNPSALDAALGNTFKMVATGDNTISVPTNKPASGKVQKIVIMHEASGGNRTLTLTTGSAGAFRFGTTITGTTLTSSGLVDYIGCVYNDADDRWDVTSYVKGY